MLRQGKTIEDGPADCDNYVLGKKLGAGSFGQILEGKERKTGRRVAVKLEERRATRSCTTSSGCTARWRAARVSRPCTGTVRR